MDDESVLLRAIEYQEFYSAKFIVINLFKLSYIFKIFFYSPF